MITRAQLEAVYRKDGTTAAGEKLAEHLFITYNGSGARRWETFDGRPVPQWSDLSPDVRLKWTNAAVEALLLLRPPRETSCLDGLIRAAVEGLSEGLSATRGAERPVIRLTVSGPEWSHAMGLGPVYRDSMTGHPAVRTYAARRDARSAYWSGDAVSAPPPDMAVEQVEVLLLFGGPGGKP